MSIFRILWIITWMCLATSMYGVEALYIALAGHIGITLGARLLAHGSTLYLMYFTVHNIGWGCFCLILISFLWVKLTYYPSGAIQHVEVGWS